MRPRLGPRITVPQAMESGSGSSQDHPTVPNLSHETKEYCENLYVKATINQFILVARNYPVAIVVIICLCRSVVNRLVKVAVRYYCRIRCSAAISISKSGWSPSPFFVADGFQLSLGLSDSGVEVTQLVTGVLNAVATIQYLSFGPAPSYFAHIAVADLYITDSQAAAAIDIFRPEGMLILFTPLIGNHSSVLLSSFLVALYAGHSVQTIPQ